MPTLNIVGNILSDTEANWGADTTVYTDKQMLVSTDAQYGATDQNKFKLANGTDTWTNLDYMPIGGANKMLWTFFNGVRFNPVDSTNYYFTQWGEPSPNSTEAFAKSFAPVAMTIKGATVSSVQGAASNENVSY